MLRFPHVPSCFRLGLGGAAVALALELLSANATMAGTITAAQAHSLSVQDDGIVCAAGENQYGQLGDGTVVERWSPVTTVALASPISVSTNERHSLAVSNDG